MKVETRNIEDLKPNPVNPRRISKADMEKLKNSLKTFGQAYPIPININAKRYNYIIGGHQTWKAAQELGWKKIEVRLMNLSEEKEEILNIALNKISGFWDDDLLKGMLKNINDSEEDIKLTGFDDEEINEILCKEDPEVEEDTIDVNAYERAKSKTKVNLGDIYQLGNHILMCGDSTKESDVGLLMLDEKADLVFTDPPYGVNFTKKSKEIFNNKEYCEIENDSMTIEETSKNIWKPVFKNMYDVSKDECSFYMTMPQGGDQMMMMMMMSENWQVKHELIWIKESAVFSMNRLDYDYKHEPIMYGWKKKHNFYRKGEFTNSVWEINRDSDKSHPTMKPIRLIANALNNSSKKEDIVLDLFGGSGSTLIACEQLNRSCYMMEIDPVYVQVILDRWEKLTNQKAVKS